jgi:hypothetical protein
LICLNVWSWHWCEQTTPSVGQLYQQNTLRRRIDERSVIVFAGLTLYIDYLNLFILLLQLTGDRRS